MSQRNHNQSEALSVLRKLAEDRQPERFVDADEENGIWSALGRVLRVDLPHCVSRENGVRHSRIGRQTASQLYRAVLTVSREKGTDLCKLLDGHLVVPAPHVPLVAAASISSPGEELTREHRIALDVSFCSLDRKVKPIHNIMVRASLIRREQRLNQAFAENKKNGSKYASNMTALAKMRGVDRANAIPRKSRQRQTEPSLGEVEVLTEIAMATGRDVEFFTCTTVELVAEVAYELLDGTVTRDEATAFSVYKFAARRPHTNSLNQAALVEACAALPALSASELREAILQVAAALGPKLANLSADYPPLNRLIEQMRLS